KTTATGEAPTTAEATPDEVLDLEAFTPLLALPELRAAREAIDAGDTAVAAERVREVLERSEWRGVERARAEYLLARLEEESGRCESAARAYTSASEVSWELTHYALLGAGRCWLQVDEPAQALAALGQVPLEGPVGNGLRPLLAEAAERTGDLERAGQLWS